VPFGEYPYTVDGKGRLVVPPPFRSFVEDGMILTRGMEGCLYVFPEATWGRIETQLAALPLDDRDGRAFVRFFYSGASRVRVDGAGRITLPPTLRTFADLTAAAIVAGAPNRLEIWSEERWWTNLREVQAQPPAPGIAGGLIG
jgi:MraZ protein